MRNQRFLCFQGNTDNTPIVAHCNPLYLDGEMVILGIEYMLCSGPTGSIPNLPCRREPSCIKAC